MKAKFGLSLICILSTLALMPNLASASDASDEAGPCLHSNSSLISEMSRKVATPAQVATAVALASDPRNIVLNSDLTEGLTQDQLNNLYGRADHFDKLARQAPGTPASQEFGKAANEIRATQAAQTRGDLAGLKFHLKNIFKIFGNSWRFMLQPGPLVALGVGTAGYIGTHGHISTESNAYFNKHRWRGVGYDVGNYVGQGALLIPWVAVSALSGNTKMEETTDQILGGALTNMVITESLKFGVNQPRPYGGNYGFPSGHSSFSFETATVIAKNYGWKAGIPAFLIAGFVGFSRVKGDMHTPAQVIAGAAIGTATGLAATDAFESEHHFTIAPGDVGGAPGIVFTKTLKSN